MPLIIPPQAGLMVRSHSMQISGATIWHALKMDTLDIQHFGRWKSDEFLKYIWGAWLENPQDLWASEQFFSSRQITHIFCNCTGIAKVSNIGRMPTNIFRWELHRDRIEAKSFGGVVLVQVWTVHYLAQPGNKTLPHLSCKQGASPKWFHCFFRSNTLWFTYLAYTRLRTKSNASSQSFGKKIMVRNVAFITNEDWE